MFVDTFIRRPILASVCSLVIILAGAIAIPTLPIAQFPELAPPQVPVTAFYNGANAETVETAVTTPIEQAINGVEGMQYMTSTSGNDGTCAVTVTFDITRNLDIAAVDVQNRDLAGRRAAAERGEAGRHLGDEGLDQLRARGRRPSPRHGEYDTLFISNYVDRFVRDEIKRVPGVGDVIVFGIGRYAMRLWLDPDRLAGRGITADEVVQALREQNVQVAAGQVGAAPARAGQTYQISVRAVGPPDRAGGVRQHHPQAIARRRARPREGRRPRRARRRELRDRVALPGPRRRRLRRARSCRPPTRCRCTATSSAEIERLSQRFPPGLKIEVAFDTTTRRRRVDPRGRDDAARGDRRWSSSSCSCSSRTGGRR